MKQQNEELVLCFDKKYFLQDEFKAESDNATLLKILHTPGATAYVPRSEAESSDKWLQLIPYCIFCKKNEETGFLYEKILIYKRGKSGSEGRLHNKYSIGFGGHVNPEDTAQSMRHGKFIPGGAAKECLRRELIEELKNLDPATTVMTTGTVLYDPTSPVSAVHIGWVFMISVNGETPLAANEDSIQDMEWVNLTELNSNAWRDKLESWAAILVKKLAEARFFHAVKAGLKKDA